AGYQMLNCGCQRHYLYSYSAGNADSDGAYQASTTLGGWNATAGCTSTEGGGIAFYAAMRRHLAAPATSCSAIKTANAAAPSGMYPIDSDGAGPLPTLMAYCDMTTDGG